MRTTLLNKFIGEIVTLKIVSEIMVSNLQLADNYNSQ